MRTTAGLAAVALLAFGAGAAQADGYAASNVSDAPIMVSDNDWSGFFISGSVGYGWGNTDVDVGGIIDNGVDVLDIVGKGDADPEGFLGSVGLGYDWTFGRGLVFGVFGDYTFGELDDKFDFRISEPIPATFGPVKAEYDDIWAVGVRAGYVIHKDLLLYGTVGYTAADFDLSGEFSDDVDGYFVGAGLERKLHGGWYLKGEYRYSDLGDSKHSQTATGGGPCTPTTCRDDLDVEHDIHSVRLGIAYKFGARREEVAPLK